MNALRWCDAAVSVAGFFGKNYYLLISVQQIVSTSRSALLLFEDFEKELWYLPVKIFS